MPSPLTAPFFIVANLPILQSEIAISLFIILVVQFFLVSIIGVSRFHQYEVVNYLRECMEQISLPARLTGWDQRAQNRREAVVGGSDHFACLTLGRFWKGVRVWSFPQASPTLGGFLSSSFSNRILSFIPVSIGAKCHFAPVSR